MPDSANSPGGNLHFPENSFALWRKIHNILLVVLTAFFLGFVMLQGERPASGFKGGDFVVEVVPNPPMGPFALKVILCAVFLASSWGVLVFIVRLIAWLREVPFVGWIIKIFAASVFAIIAAVLGVWVWKEFLGIDSQLQSRTALWFNLLSIAFVIFFGEGYDAIRRTAEFHSLNEDWGTAQELARKDPNFKLVQVEHVFSSGAKRSVISAASLVDGSVQKMTIYDAPSIYPEMVILLDEYNVVARVFSSGDTEVADTGSEVQFLESAPFVKFVSGILRRVSGETKAAAIKEDRQISGGAGEGHSGQAKPPWEV